MAAPKKVDYEQIEPGWRAGIKSPPQLAADYTAATGTSVSHTAIKKHFAKLGVPRDLAAKVKAKADSMVLESMVTGKVSTATTKRDAAIIDESATLIAMVRLSQRQDIQRGRGIARALFQELEGQAGPENAALLAQLGTLMAKPDEKGIDKLNDLYQKVISLPGRAKTMKDLGESLRTLVALERQAFGIDDAPADGGAAGFLEAMLDARARAS